MDKPLSYNIIEPLKYKPLTRLIITISLAFGFLITMVLVIILASRLTNSFPISLLIMICNLTLSWYFLTELEDKWIYDTKIIDTISIDDDTIKTKDIEISIRLIKRLILTKYISVYKSRVKYWKTSYKLEILMKDGRQFTFYVSNYHNGHLNPYISDTIWKLKKQNIENYRAFQIYED
jgi:hypothetical protein